MIDAGKTGTAPGTTTITLPRNGRPQLAGPTDFDLAKIRGYLPYHRGWIVGGRAGGKSLEGLGQMPNPAEGETIDPAVAEEILTTYQARQARARAIQAEEQIKSQRAERIWLAVSTLVGVGGLVVSIISLSRTK